jgi:hypothetical protein
MTKSYMTVWQRWADAKVRVANEYNRLSTLIESIKVEIKQVSGQNIPSHRMCPVPRLYFSPWVPGGWIFLGDIPQKNWGIPHDHDQHWSWSLKETEAVAAFLEGLEEEEVRILFRQWEEMLLTD